MVRIRLKKFGTKRKPYYRVVIMDQRDPRDGRTIEEVGLFHPLEDGEKQISLNQERVKYWLSVGAVPSDTVRGILNQRQICVK